MLDDCGVCEGGNADQDCAGECFGDAMLDDCGVCEGGNADMDCEGVCDGDAMLDCAGECEGSNLACHEQPSVLHGTYTVLSANFYNETCSGTSTPYDLVIGESIIVADLNIASGPPTTENPEAFLMS